MNKYLLLTVIFCATIFTCCSKSGNNDSDDEIVRVSLSVFDIKDNCATISISLTEGVFNGAKLVDAVRTNSLTFDYTNEIKLIQYVREYGFDIDVPYNSTLTNLRADVEMLTAVIVFDSYGAAVSSKYQIWVSAGDPWAWSEGNGAGGLDESEWPSYDPIEGGGTAGGVGEVTWPTPGEELEGDGTAGDLEEVIWDL